MNRFRLKVILGLFFSTFFIRLGFFLVGFFVCVLLRNVNRVFLPIGVACLAFDLIVSVIDTARCVSAMKKSTGDPDADAVLQAAGSDTPYEDVARAVDKLIGTDTAKYDRPGNLYLPVADRMKLQLADYMNAKDAAEVFRMISDEEAKEGEALSFSSLVGTRYSDGKTYYVLNFNLAHEEYSLSFNMLFRHSVLDPRRDIRIECSGDRDAFYEEVLHHYIFTRYENTVPEHVDVICGSNRG